MQMPEEVDPKPEQPEGQERPEPAPSIPSQSVNQNPWDLPPMENQWNPSAIPPPPKLGGPRKSVASGLWAIVFVFFGLMIWGAIAETFVSDSVEPRVLEYFDQEKIPDIAGQRISEDERAEKREEILERLYGEPINDAGVAKSILVMETEDGVEQPSLDAIAELKASPDAGDRTLAGLYENPPQSIEELDERFSEFKDSGLNEIAYMQFRESLGDTEIRSEILAPMSTATAMLVGGALFMALGLGVVLLILFFVFRATKRLVPVGFNLHHDPRVASASAAVKTLLWLFIFLFASTIGYGVGTLMDLSGIGMLIALALGTTLATLLTVILIPRITVFGQSTTFTAMLGEKSEYGKNILFGVGAAVANIPILLLITVPMLLLSDYLPRPSHPISDEIAGGTGLIQFAILLYMAAVLAPLMEEVIFRGVMAPGLKAHFGSFWWGLIVSSLLFAAIHPQGILLIPTLAAIGGMAAYVSHLRGSLLPAIVMHAVHNGALLTMAYLITT